MNPQSRKFVRVAPGAGNRLRQHQIAITVHSQEALEDAVVSSAPRAGGSGAVLLIDDIGCPLRLEQTLRSWRKKELQYTIADLPDVAGLPKDVVRAAITKLVAQGACASAAADRLCAVPGGTEEATAFESLAVLGFVDIVRLGNELEVKMTSAGGKRLAAIWSLHDPVEVCKPRTHLALEDATDYELMRMLLDDTWQWEP